MGHKMSQFQVFFGHYVNKKSKIIYFFFSFQVILLTK